MNAQTKLSPIAELMTRAGASDSQREQWLAERRQGVTATEVRDLAIGKIKAQDLIDLKLGRKVDSFSGNAFTEWGKRREVVIAEQLLGQGIAPESRVFCAVANERHLASPDGIGIDFDGDLVVSEIKTCGHALPIGSQALKDKGYLLQVQWVMYVTGATRCLLVVEERLDGVQPGTFEPGPIAQDWVERDEKVIGALVVIADEFLAELDRQRTEGGPGVDEALDTHAVNYIRHLRAEGEAKKAKETEFAAIKKALNARTADEFVQESLLARISWKRGREVTETVDEERLVVDVDAAREASPKVWARVEAAVARVERAEASLARAQEASEKAAAAWAKATAAHTTTETVVVETVTKVRENLTVTAMSEKKQKGLVQ